MSTATRVPFGTSKSPTTVSTLASSITTIGATGRRRIASLAIAPAQTSLLAVVSFIISFGVIKAFANLISGHLADVWGRKRVLILGWLVGLRFPS
jgi:MFS family permease